MGRAIAQQVSRTLGDSGHHRWRTWTRFEAGIAGYKVVQQGDAVLVYDWPVGRPDVLQRWKSTLVNSGYSVEVNLTQGVRNWHLVVTRGR